MSDTERLEEALRNAAAAGDEEAARRLAQEIRERRASEVTEQVPSIPTIPIGNRNAALPPVGARYSFRGRTVTDPDILEAMELRPQLSEREQRILDMRIAGRLFAQESGRFSAFMTGVGSGLFGLGDSMAAGIHSFMNPNLSFTEALERYRSFRRGLEEDFPLTSGLGNVAGALTGGGGLGLGLRGAAAVTRAGQAVRNLTQLQPGQRLANTARLAGGGAIAGGITEGMLGEDPAQGALTGAVGGPLGAQAVRALSRIPGAFSRVFDEAGLVVRDLAQRLDVDPDLIAGRVAEFTRATGTRPSIIDILDPRAVEDLRETIRTRPGAIDEANRIALERQATRASEFAEQVRGGRVTTTDIAERARQSRLAGRQFGSVADETVTFSPKQVEDLLSDANFRGGIPITLRRRLDEVLDQVPEGSPVELTVEDIEYARLELRERAKAGGANRVFQNLADQIEKVARSQIPAYGDAIDEFSRRALRREGVEQGRRLVTQDTSQALARRRAAQTAEEGAGQRVGARSQLVDIAGESAASANRLAMAFSEEGGLVSRLRSVLPEDQIEELQQLGRAQARSFRNQGRIAPAIRAETDEAVTEAARNIVDLAVASTGRTSPQFLAGVFTRVLRTVRPGISEKRATELARLAFDPERTDDVIRALRRGGLRNDQILDVFALSAAGGQTGVGDPALDAIEGVSEIIGGQ